MPYIYKWSMLVIRPERLSVSSPVTLTWQSLVIYEEFLRCFKTHYHLCHSWCFVSVLQLMFLAYLFFLVWLGVTAFTSLPVFMYFNVWSMCQNTSVVEGANLCLDLRQFGVYNDNVTYLWNGWMEVSNLPFFNSLFYHVSGLQYMGLINKSNNKKSSKKQETRHIKSSFKIHRVRNSAVS